LILNGDRRTQKPNSLTNGERIVLIDHEKALNCTLIGRLEEPPWSGDALQRVEAAAPHLFQGRFARRDTDLTRLHEAWRNVGPIDIARYRAAIPASWAVNPQMLDETFAYLDALSKNIDSAFEKLYEVLP